LLKVLQNITLEAPGRRALVPYIPNLLTLLSLGGPAAPEVLGLLTRLTCEQGGRQALVPLEAEIQQVRGGRAPLPQRPAAP
jgi:hypothetical protein